jgi:acetyl-CoA synthetase
MATNDVASPAPWLDVPGIVEEVSELRRRFSATDLTVASVLCDDHPAEDIAFVAVDRDLETEHLTYGALADRSKRLARALRERGITRGSRVGVLMGKTSQLPVVLLAIWRLGAVHVPLFTAFAGPAIRQRLEGANATLVVADADQHHKLEGIAIPVLTTGADVDELVGTHAPIESSEAIGPDGLFIQLYTSGTTGTPKGVGVPAFAIASFISYMTYGLGLSRDDVFWNVADPGWAYGLYYAIVGPLATGTANILLASGFSAELTIRVIEELRVTNLAASPTVYRALKKDGPRLRTSLRAASSAGEPLTPDVVAWAPAALGTSVRDHWGQTEQGMGIVNAWDERLRREVRPGSMGQALPGFVAGTLGSSIVLSVAESPLMWFTGYVGAPRETSERFTVGRDWYLTGDVGRAEAGNFYFASRDDDVILAAGYRIAPFDIESVLASDPDVAEAAVVGRPDEVRGEVVEAFVILNSGAGVGDLEKRLQARVRNEYGAHAYPRRVHVVTSLPKTPSGKVQRFVLRALSDREVDDLTFGGSHQ